MDYIYKLKKKIERKIRCRYILIKKKPRYVVINVLELLALRLLWIVVYSFCVIMNLPFDSIVRKIFDGGIHVDRIFEWLRNFIANIDFKKIVSFLQNVPSNFRQTMTHIIEFINKRYRDLKRILRWFYGKKRIIAQIKLCLIEHLPEVKRIIKSGIKVICSFICTKMGMLFIIPFLGIKIIFAGKDISIVATLILCGIFSWIGMR